MTKEMLGSLELDRIYQMDCIEGMKLLPDKSIDMILCDLPYGTTACKWDSVIPFEPLWEQYERIIKDDGAIVLTATQPFSSALVMSNPKLFKYEWIWKKNAPAGFQTVKTQPLREHEVVLVFSKGTIASGSPRNMKYYPQGLIEVNKEKRVGKKPKYIGARPKQEGKVYTQKYTNYPRTVLEFSKDPRPVHPTQKPVALFEYLIKTYTLEGEIVLDNCMGSGTTAVAALRSGRHFIGFELEREYIEIANKRLENVWDGV